MRFLRHILPFLALGMAGDSSDYKKLNASKVKFSKYFQFRDNERGRQLQCFFVHGESVMAYSKKDALKRWIHRDLKHRRKHRR